MADEKNSDDRYYWVVEIVIEKELWKCSSCLYGPYDTFALAEAERQALAHASIVVTPKVRFDDVASSRP